MENNFNNGIHLDLSKITERQKKILKENKNEDGSVNDDEYLSALRKHSEFIALAEQYYNVLDKLDRFNKQHIFNDEYRGLVKEKIKLSIKMRKLLPNKTDEEMYAYIKEVLMDKKAKMINTVDLGNVRTVDYIR